MAVRTQVSAETSARRRLFALPRLGRGLRGELVAGLAAALLSLFLAAGILQVWRADLDVPFAYRSETQYYLMLAKTMGDHGGYLENPSLGAPFGLELHDYAVGTDRLNLDLLRVLSFLFGGPAAGVNVFFLLSFPLAAAAAFLVLRLLRVGKAAAVACSVLFALLPYHFARAEEHLFLSAYYAVPLGVYLVLATLGGNPLFSRRPGRSGLGSYLSGRTLTTVAFCAIVASTGVYYAAFTLLLLAGATAIALLGRLGRRTVASAALCAALIVGGLLVHLAPSIAYRSEHGPNLGTRRPTAESELLALKFTDLVLPAEDSRLGPLSRLTAQYRSTTPIRSEQGQSLGLVAGAGFLGLLAIALVALVGRARAGPPVIRHAAAATVLAFLIGTVGGISVLVAQLLTAQIRGWNRISIVIGFLALLGVAVALDWLRGAVRRRAVFAAALAGVLGVGVYSQAAASAVPPYELAGSYRQDRGFVREIERRLPPGSSVFQLPYAAFPETGQIVDLSDNDLLRGYLHSRRLRWSFGAMKGRPEDWSRELAGLPAATLVDAAVVAGFSGLYVDRFAYADRAAALEGEIGALLGGSPFVGVSGRHSFFDLRGRRRKLQAAHGPVKIAAFREAVLRPLRLHFGGFLPLRAGRATFAWAETGNAELRIVNPSDTPRTAAFDAVLDRVGGPPADVAVAFPGSALTTHRVPAQLHADLQLPPGETVIRFSTAASPVEASNANELRRHYFRLANLTLTDGGFRPFLP